VAEDVLKQQSVAADEGRIFTWAGKNFSAFYAMNQHRIVTY
jgi:hypothetical protein